MVKTPDGRKAIKFYGSDTSQCYPYHDFFIIPVTITYQVFKDNWPLSCKREFFDLKIVKGGSVRYIYAHKAMIVQTYTMNKP
jgi:hypothetical protein